MHFSWAIQFPPFLQLKKAVALSKDSEFTDFNCKNLNTAPKMGNIVGRKEGTQSEVQIQRNYLYYVVGTVICIYECLCPAFRGSSLCAKKLFQKSGSLFYCAGYDPEK